MPKTLKINVVKVEQFPGKNKFKVKIKETNVNRHRSDSGGQQGDDMIETNAMRADGSSAPACSVGFRLTTLPYIDGKITQELQEYNGDVTSVLTRWVMDSREKGVRDALVQLGWTPPNLQL